jgi:hypothetical protein
MLDEAGASGGMRQSGSWAVAFDSLASGFRRRFVGSATPGALGAIRIAVCSVAIVNTLWEQLPSSAKIPVGLRSRMGLLELLYDLPIGFERLVASRAGLTVLECLTLLFLVFGAVGFATRLMLPVAAFGYFVMGGILRQYAWFFHSGLIPLYLLVTLSFTPCGDGWSIDARRRRRRGSLVDPDLATPRYAWARYACWLVIAMPYVLAGLSKLRAGPPVWWSAVNFRKVLLGTNLKPMQFDFDVGLAIFGWPDWVWSWLGFMAVATELAYGSVLFSRHARRVVPALTALLHLGILFFQNILFFDLILLQLVFVDFDRLLRGVRGSKAAAIARGVSPGLERRYAGLLAVLSLCLVGWWSTKQEFYPFTGMQMFAGPVNESTRVNYQLIFARRASGEVFEARLDDAISALHDSRYREFISVFNSERRKNATRRLLDVVADEWNENAEPSQRVVEFEIQDRVWDFAAEPNDPEHGTIKNRFRHLVRTAENDGLPDTRP